MSAAYRRGRPCARRQASTIAIRSHGRRMGAEQHQRPSGRLRVGEASSPPVLLELPRRARDPAWSGAPPSPPRPRSGGDTDVLGRRDRDLQRRPRPAAPAARPVARTSLPGAAWRSRPATPRAAPPGRTSRSASRGGRANGEPSSCAITTRTSRSLNGGSSSVFQRITRRVGPRPIANAFGSSVNSSTSCTSYRDVGHALLARELLRLRGEPVVSQRLRSGTRNGATKVNSRPRPANTAAPGIHQLLAERPRQRHHDQDRHADEDEHAAQREEAAQDPLHVALARRRRGGGPTTAGRARRAAGPATRTRSPASRAACRCRSAPPPTRA